MREPFEELGQRITVGSDEDQFLPHRENHTSTCKHCGNVTVPTQFLQKIPSYFICTVCQLPQPNLSHPIFQQKEKTKEEIEQDIADSKITNRRTPTAKIETVKSQSNNPQELVEQVGESGQRTNIRKSSITQQTEVDMRDSHYESTAEINIKSTEPISNQVQRMIQKTVDEAQRYQQKKETHDAKVVKELRRGKT